MTRIRQAMGKELLISPGVCAIIRNADGRILLMRRADLGTWDIPGGSVEPGETPSEVLRREVHEETGLNVRISGVAGVVGGSAFRLEYPNGDRIEGFAVIFECEVIGGRLESCDGEATAFQYADPNNMPMLTSPYPQKLFCLDRGWPVIV